MSSSADDFQSSINIKVSEILPIFSQDITERKAREIGEDFYGYIQNLSSEHNTQNGLTIAFKIIEESKQYTDDYFSILNLMHFLNGFNQNQKSFNTEYNLIQRIDDLINTIFDNDSRFGKVPLPQNILYTFPNESYAPKFIKPSKKLDDNKVITKYLLNLAIEKNVVAELSEGESYDEDDIKKLNSYCREFWIGVSLAVIYDRILEYRNRGGGRRDPNFDLRKYALLEVSKYKLLRKEGKPIANPSMFFGVQDIISTEKCISNNEIGWAIKTFLGYGQFGDVYEACCKNDCKYVMKIARKSSSEELRKEIELQNLAAQAGYAPVIKYAGIRDGSTKEYSTSIIIMEKGGIPLEKITERFWGKVDKEYFDDQKNYDEILGLYKIINNRFMDLYVNLGIIHVDSHDDNIMIHCSDSKVLEDKSSFINSIQNQTCNIMIIDFGMATDVQSLDDVEYAVKRYDDILENRRYWLKCNKKMHTRPEWEDFLVYYMNAMIFSYSPFPLEIKERLFTDIVRSNPIGIGSKSGCKSVDIKDDVIPKRNKP
jgi:serine/threonine protein kinase